MNSNLSAKEFNPVARRRAKNLIRRQFFTIPFRQTGGIIAIRGLFLASHCDEVVNVLVERRREEVRSVPTGDEI